MSKYKSGETGDFDDYFINDLNFLDDYIKPNSLWLWGANSYGQLGTSNYTHRSSPIQVTNSGIWNSADIRGDNTAAIKNDGTLWLWGANTYGQLGISTTLNKLIPTQNIIAGTDWNQVSVGWKFTCAIKTDGTLWTCGDNSLQQLGRKLDAKIPYMAFDLSQGIWNQTGIVTEVCYNDHLGAIDTSGKLWLWGANTYGQLGDGTRTIRSSTVQIGAGTDWKQVAFGRYHTAAIKTDGTLWTWGYNAYGQLGLSNLTNRSSPVQVGTGTDWKQVSCGEIHTAAVKTGGTLWTWGGASFGALGNSTTTPNRQSPVQTIVTGTTWSQVSCGSGFTIAVKTDGTLWLWGANSYGQLGRSDRIHRSTPIQTLLGGTNWAQVSCASTYFSAVRTDNKIYSCGNNNYGQLGDTTTTNKSVMTQEISGGTNWSKVICGGNCTGAITTTNQLYMWGDNSTFQCGSSDRIPTLRRSPITTAMSTSDWYHIYFSYTSTVGIKTDGTLWTWGNWPTDSDLIIQSDINANSLYFIQTNYNTPSWREIDSGCDFSLGIKTDGTLWGWGSNQNGQLGTSSIYITNSPVQTLAQGSNWKQVNCGYNFSTAIKTDGTLWTWGNNTLGQLGLSNLTNRSSPVQVGTGTDWKQVSTGYIFTVALKTDGTLWSWGGNSYGQLGNGTFTHRSSPVQIGISTDWKQIACGYDYVLAIKTDTTVFAWGANQFGQLGNSSIVNISTPINISGIIGNNWKKIATGVYTSLGIKYESE
jgi:alpha-tubulin suppressor-like RCC1 family protein